MSTNDPSIGTDVSSLSTLRRRYHLEHLLEMRYDLAITAVQLLSHDMDGADQVYEELLLVETQIRDQFPDTYAQSWSRWVEDDARRLHGPGVLVIDCTLCTDIAAASGLNLEEPEAA
jgi:hypothetical protein